MAFPLSNNEGNITSLPSTKVSDKSDESRYCLHNAGGDSTMDGGKGTFATPTPAFKTRNADVQDVGLPSRQKTIKRNSKTRGVDVESRTSAKTARPAKKAMTVKSSQTNAATKVKRVDAIKKHLKGKGEKCHEQSYVRRPSNPYSQFSHAARDIIRQQLKEEGTPINVSCNGTVLLQFHDSIAFDFCVRTIRINLLLIL
jgi:hypothetical protein